MHIRRFVYICCRLCIDHNQNENEIWMNIFFGPDLFFGILHQYFFFGIDFGLLLNEIFEIMKVNNRRQPLCLFCVIFLLLIWFVVARSLYLQDKCEILWVNASWFILFKSNFVFQIESFEAKYHRWQLIKKIYKSANSISAGSGATLW